MASSASTRRSKRMKPTPLETPEENTSTIHPIVSVNGEKVSFVSFKNGSTPTCQLRNAALTAFHLMLLENVHHMYTLGVKSKKGKNEEVPNKNKTAGG